MQSVSTLFESILAGDYRVEVKVNIAGTEYGMDAITSLRTSRSAFGEGSPELGKAPAGEISLSLYAESGAIPRMAQLSPCIRVVNDTQQSEWIQKGSYFVDTRSRSSQGIVTLTGYDAMLKACRIQPGSTLSWPAADIDAVNEIAGYLGVSVDARTTALMSGGFRIPIPARYTMRETLQYIAALYGGSFVITNENTLLLLCIWNVEASPGLSLGSASQSLELSPAFDRCSGVRFLIDEDTEVSAGDDTGRVYEISCPWATQAAADALLSRMSGFVYQPWEADTAIINPAFELGDSIGLGEAVSAIWSENLRFGALLTAGLAAPEDEAIDHEYPYESAEERKYYRQVKSFESELTLQSQQIAAKVSRVGGDAASFGWYLDAEGFDLKSQGATVFRADDTGVEVTGQITATSGRIGGCEIENGTLMIANANIESLNASKINAGTLAVGRLGTKSITGAKIADLTLASTKIADGAAVNRVIGTGSVSYAKTSFQGTLDQVGTNQANIDTLFGYFTGSASFSSLSAAMFWLGSCRINAGTAVPIGGVNYNLVTWS